MTDQRLVRQLAWAVALKLALLAGLWALLVRDAGVPVDPGAAARHLISVPAPSDAATAADPAATAALVHLAHPGAPR